MPVLVKKDLACFQIQEVVFHFSILLQRLLHHLLGPAERYEAEFMGAIEFLNRRLNEEFQCSSIPSL